MCDLIVSVPDHCLSFHFTVCDGQSVGAQRLDFIAFQFFRGRSSALKIIP